MEKEIETKVKARFNELWAEAQSYCTECGWSDYKEDYIATLKPGKGWTSCELQQFCGKE